MNCYEGNRPYIFFSYCHKDNELAEKILNQLDERGYRIWYDADIGRGDEWFKTLCEKINNCSVFVALATDAYIKSDYCKYEMLYAKSLNKKRFCFRDGTQEITGIVKDCFNETNNCECGFNDIDEIMRLIAGSELLAETKRETVFVSYKNSGNSLSAMTEIKKELKNKKITVWDPGIKNNDERYRDDLFWFTSVYESEYFIGVLDEESLKLNEHSYFKLITALRREDKKKYLVSTDEPSREKAKEFKNAFKDVEIFYIAEINRDEDEIEKLINDIENSIDKS